MSALLNDYVQNTVHVAPSLDDIGYEEVASRSSVWARGMGTLLILWLALMVSGVTLVYSKHMMRQRVYELQALQEDWDHMQVEWHRMLLEQSTWGGLNRIEREAVGNLGMRVPNAGEVVIVKRS